jgi:hypothetical protein
MSWGILEMIGSVMVLIFAIPAALAGVELLLGGNPLGAGLLGAALTMVVVDQYVTTFGDLPTLIVSKVVGTVAQPPDEE